METAPTTAGRRVPEGKPLGGVGIDYGVVTGISRPFPIQPLEFVTIDFNAFDGFFTMCYEAANTLLYPDSLDALEVVITAEQWCLVSKYFLKQRVDHVYSSASGRRPIDRIPISANFALPAAYAVLFNGIGVHGVNMGGYKICPQSPTAPADAAQRLQNRVTHDMLSHFSNVVNTLAVRGFIRTGYISRADAGTGWWLLTARKTGIIGEIATADTLSVRILSQFPEFTPSDAFMAAIVRRRFDGNLAGYVANAFTWTVETIRDVNPLVAQFFATAEP